MAKPSRVSVAINFGRQDKTAPKCALYRVINRETGDGARNPPPDIRFKMGANRGKPGRKLSPEAIEILRRANQGKRLSAETREKMSAAAKARKRGPLSTDHRAALSRKFIGRVVSDETRAKISASSAGRQLTPGHVAKLRAGYAAYREAGRA